MPRKLIPRCIKLSLKYCKGSGTKALATKKLQASQGTVGAKFAAAPDCSQPNKPSAQPLRWLTHHSSSFQRSGAFTGSLAPGQHSILNHCPDFLRAPSFAAAPIWHASLLAGADHAQGLHSMNPTASAQPTSKPVPPSPLQQYAGLASLLPDVGAQPEKPASPAKSSSALSWYGNLSNPKACKDKASPAAKAPARAPTSSRQRLRNAYAAYAAMAP